LFRAENTSPGALRPGGQRELRGLAAGLSNASRIVWGFGRDAEKGTVRVRQQLVAEEAKVVHGGVYGFEVAVGVFKDGADDGFECRDHHLGGDIDCPCVLEDVGIETESEAAAG